MTLVAQLAAGAVAVAALLFGALKLESVRLDRQDAEEQRATQDAREAARG